MQKSLPLAVAIERFLLLVQNRLPIASKRISTELADGQADDGLKRGTPRWYVDFGEIDGLGVLVRVRVRSLVRAGGMPMKGQHARSIGMAEVVGVTERTAAVRSGVVLGLHHSEVVSDVENQIIAESDRAVFLTTDK